MEPTSASVLIVLAPSRSLTRPEYESIRSVSVRSAIAGTVAILGRTGPVGVVLVIAGFLAGPGEVSIFK